MRVPRLSFAVTRSAFTRPGCCGDVHTHAIGRTLLHVHSRSDAHICQQVAARSASSTTVSLRPGPSVESPPVVRGSVWSSAVGSLDGFRFDDYSSPSSHPPILRVLSRENRFRHPYTRYRTRAGKITLAKRVRQPLSHKDIRCIPVRRTHAPDIGVFKVVPPLGISNLSPSPHPL